MVLTQGPPVHESVHPWGRAAGVGQEEEESRRDEAYLQQSRGIIVGAGRLYLE